MTRTGLWCDVVPQPAGFLLISTQGDSSVTATREDGTLAWRCPTKEPLWYLRAAALPNGTICAIGNGHETGQLQVVIAAPDGTVRASVVAGLVSWGQCIEGQGDHWLAAVQLSPRTWQMLSIYTDGKVEPGPVQPIPVWPGGDGSTSQGFLQMIHGEPVWSDPNRVATIEGHQLLLPVRAGEAACGQTEDGVWWALAGGYACRAIPGAAMWPRLAQSGDRYAVCAWTYPATNTMTVIQPPYPRDTVAEPVLPTVPASLRGRRLWLGYFKCISDQYGDNPTAPGNCTYLETAAEAARSPWPYFAPIGVGDGPRKIASVVSIDPNAPPTDLPSHVVALYDGGSRLPSGPCGTLTGLECYSDPGEAFPAVEARLRAWLQAYPTARVILIGQGYTRNGTETNRQKLADLQGLPFRLAADFAQVEGVLIFSDGRPTGTRANEWWRPVHTAAAALVVAPAVFGGTADAPRQTSSLDPAYLRAAVAASWLGMRGEVISTTEQDYWVNKASHPETYSDGIVRIGWNAYFEARMAPGNDGSADPKLGDQPARFQPTMPAPDPPPTPPPTTDLAARVGALEAALAGQQARVALIEAALRACGQALS